MLIRELNSPARPLALIIALSLGLAACSSDPARVNDTQVRSSDRPECQLSAMRGKVPMASGTETTADPCGNSGTFPIITGEDLKK